MDKAIRRCRVPRSGRIILSKYQTEDTGRFGDGADGSKLAEQENAGLKEKISSLQDRLYAESEQSLLIILQGMDAGGKDGTIKHVMSHVNPQSCSVVSFKVPTPPERAHDFLWRVHQVVPPHGFIGIFNRSHYEDVLVTRVHGQVDDRTARLRFRQINDFERMLSENGVTILKLFLHISASEQKKRLEARLRDPNKHWKFNPADLVERKRWKEYQRMYEDVLKNTNTPWARWWVIPGDVKWYRNHVVASLVEHMLKKMDPHYPPPPQGVDFSKIVIV